MLIKKKKKKICSREQYVHVIHFDRLKTEFKTLFNFTDTNTKQGNYKYQWNNTNFFFCKNDLLYIFEHENPKVKQCFQLLLYYSIFV